ncbi:MAG: hypothetical protein L6V86_08795 [Treponema sp.]|nr:MAG: hypothetical protein L6V86_08795 [Treponema sp.]
MKYKIDWRVNLYGTICIEADSEEEAEEILRNTSDIELIQKSEDVDSCLDYDTVFAEE